MISRSQAIKLFLDSESPAQAKDLAELYNLGMECQVNVAQDDGQRIEGDYQGRKWHGWSNGLTTWKSFRIPYEARTKPHYDDPEMGFPIEQHAEGIGMTGWDWKNLVSKWVAYDFDSIVGHKAGLSDQELLTIQERAGKLEYVTIRKSTSGKGIHLYVFLDNVPTANHNEHAALARAILGKISAETGYDFTAAVDTCGGNIWVWHRKVKGTDGFTLLKRGSTLKTIPPNWKEHLNVVKGAAKRANAPEQGSDFDKIVGQHVHVPLDEEHRRLISFLESASATVWWDLDRHLLVTHTTHLTDAHKTLKLQGIFATESTKSTPHNCFMFPMRRGAWIVRRFGQGVQESDSWSQDSAGWTFCYFNKEPDLKIVAKMCNGVRLSTHYAFNVMGAENLKKALELLKVKIEVPTWILNREAKLRLLRGKEVEISIKHSPEDKLADMPGWAPHKGWWSRICEANIDTEIDVEVEIPDNLIRHIITESGEDYGWVINSDKLWVREPLSHIKPALISMGVDAKEINHTLGSSIMNRWILVNRPFQPEYPGNKEWNKDSVQFAFTPSDKERETLNYPHWCLVLQHCGHSLDEAIQANAWCKQAGIISGADYLKCWIASMIQKPLEPLPYLFLWGPQNCGKTIFHEAVQLLMTGGYIQADNALLNPQGFNGELANKVLCVIEETDLSKSGNIAYNRIKDWVTSRNIQIHPKKETPYTVKNSLHFVQCANTQGSCPIFAGDTRITVIRVGALEKVIPKRDLIASLEAEGPDFLRSLIDLEIPRSNDRLNLPVLETQDKIDSMELSKNELELFFTDKVKHVPGKWIPFSELYDTFLEYIDAKDRFKWSKIRVGREIPTPYIKGRCRENSQFHVANASWTAEGGDGKVYVMDKGFLHLQEKA